MFTRCGSIGRVLGGVGRIGPGATMRGLYRMRAVPSYDYVLIQARLLLFDDWKQVRYTVFQFSPPLCVLLRMLCVLLSMWLSCSFKYLQRALHLLLVSYPCLLV